MPISKSIPNEAPPLQTLAARILQSGHDGSALESHILVPPFADGQLQSMEHLRHAFESRRVRYADPDLELFVTQVFADEALLAAYFLPKASSRRSAQALTASGPSLVWIPFEVAAAAASRAQAMPLVNNWERSLVHLAAFLYPCAMFFRSCEISPYAQESFIDGDEAETIELRACLLEGALRTLRARDATKAATLSALLGQDCADVDAGQISRMASAVCTVQIKAYRVWGMQS